jgi:NADP-dependent 3-hydroxy acid dehydrogenase YdfG
MTLERARPRDVTPRRVIDVEVNGVFHTMRAALAALIERKGYVLVVSSPAAYAAGPLGRSTSARTVALEARDAGAP